MTVKYVVWCCSIFQMMNFVKWRELLLSFCSQWTLCRDPVIWNAARSPSGVMPQPVESHAALLERVERCTAVLECEGRCVRVCYHWHHRDSFHYKQVLHYGTDYITEGSTVHFCVTETTKPYGTNYCSRVHDRLWCVSVFSISLWQKNVKYPSV